MDVERLTELAASAADRDPLVGLDAVARLRAETERVEAVLVRRARNNGATWPQIAAVLGVSKQAVHKKYAGRGLFGGRS
ncbi:helix-turn-helix domain-containing protein [Streptomyces sp. 4N509B]|uniref:helix-turn-helix domain-containing protein n=1 Tax=Streptomyces sp. 4N509B TaxID=3457413 RepID=UPI003FD3A637